VSFTTLPLLSLRLCILTLLANGSVNTFPRQRRIFGRVILYSVCVLSEESRRLVLPRTSCLYSSSIYHSSSLWLNISHSKVLYSKQGLRFSHRWLWRIVLEYTTVYFVESQPVFRRNVSPPFLPVVCYPFSPSSLTCRQLTLTKTAVWVIGYWASPPRRGYKFWGGGYWIYFIHSWFLTKKACSEGSRF
jgi:hypothetical protein